eukprot:6528743-Lingulodinium_polyedra.AAC.1
MSQNSSPDCVPEPWMKYPAMWEFLKDPTDTLTRKRGKCKDPKYDDMNFLPGDQAIEDLIRKRVELGIEGQEEEWKQFFKWTLRGGRWTGEHKGVAFDCYAAYTLKGTEAETFVSCFPKLRM